MAGEMGDEEGHPLRTQETCFHIGQPRTMALTRETNLQRTVAGSWWRREMFGDEDNTWKMDCCCECLSPALRSEPCQGRYMLVKTSAQVVFCICFTSHLLLPILYLQIRP